MRQIRFRFLPNSISDAVAGEIIKSWRPPSCDERGRLPFYQVFPRYPEYDPVAPFVQRSLEELSRFQAEIIAARASVGDDGRARALDLRTRYFYRRAIQKASPSNCFTLPRLHRLGDYSRVRRYPPEGLRNSPLSRNSVPWHCLNPVITTLPSERFENLFYTETPRSAAVCSAPLQETVASHWFAGDLGPRHLEYENGMNTRPQPITIPPPTSRALPHAKTQRRPTTRPVFPPRHSNGLVSVPSSRSSDEWLIRRLLGRAFDAGDVEKLRTSPTRW